MHDSPNAGPLISHRTPRSITTRRTARRRRGWLHDLVVMATMVAAVSIVITPQHTSAAIHNPIPMDANENPNDLFTDQDALLAFVTSDIKGGTICIVPATVQTADGGSCKHPAWGSPNFIVGIGSVIQLIEAPRTGSPLTPGNWKLLTEDTDGTGTGLSDVFSVIACDTCSRAIANDAVAKWKALAKSNQDGANKYCSIQELRDRVDAAKKIGEKKLEWTDTGVTLISVSFSPLGGFAFDIADPLVVLQQKALEILKDLTCAVSNMYGDIVKDPPDFGYANVATPAIGTVAAMPAPEETALAEAIAAQVGYGAASLTAFERYLGAQVDFNLDGMSRQAHAVADNSQLLVDAVRNTTEALDAFATYADTQPEFNGPLTATQTEVDDLAAGYARVRATDFTAAELQRLHDLGLTDVQISAFRTNFDRNLSGISATSTLADSARALAVTMRNTLVDLDAFAREAAAVAARNDLVATANVQPTAIFGASVTAGFAPLDVTFDATASSDPDGSIGSYSWDFRDGSPIGSGATITHTFTTPGDHIVMLTVHDNVGATAGSLLTINVKDPTLPPTVSLSVMSRVSPGVSRMYTAAADAGVPNALLTYDFDFGDGSPIVTTTSATGSADVEHSYATEGTFTWKVTATSAFGASGSASRPVAVANPVADAGPDFQTAEGTSALLGGPGSSPSDGGAAFVWDFGDGSVGSGRIADHVYADEGTYTATLTVRDELGLLSAIDTTVVTVDNVAPVIKGVLWTATLKAGVVASFREFATDAGVNDVLSATWNFGDGSVANGSAVDHVYAADGTYTASVTVSDGDGGSATTTRVVTVGPAVGQRDSKGREFWLAFQTNYTGGPELNLFVTGETATSGTVDVPGIGFSAPFSVVPGAATAVALPAEAMVQVLSFGTVQPLAIHVVAKDEVTVYGLNRIRFTTDAFLGLPLDVLGTDHVVSSFTGGLGSEIDVVATANNTTVNLTPVGDVVGATPGPKVFQLDAGDVVQIQGTDLTGSRVTSDHPVSVFGGTQCANIPLQVAFCDHITEQMPSTDLLGSRFVTVPLATRLLGDTVRVVATQPATEIRIGGSVVATIGAGEFYETILTQPSLIETSSPALVAQYSNGTDFDGVTSDPFMMIVPPTEQFLPSYTVTTPVTGFAANFINIVAPNAALATVRVDGAPVDPSLWVSVIGTTLSGAQVRVDLGSHTVAATSPIGVFVYGFDSFDSYGYPGGLQLARVGAVATLIVAPPSQQLLTGTQGCVAATVVDGVGAAIVDARVDYAITGANPSSGFAFTNALGIAKICWTSVSTGTDTVAVTLGDRSKTATIVWSPNRAPTADVKLVSTVEDTAVGVVLSGSDPDGDVLSFLVAAVPAHGTLSGTGASRTYTPDLNFNGPDSFTYRANDGAANSAPATVTINVTPSNDPPTLQGIAAQSIPEMVPFALTIMGNDVDGDTPLTYSVVTGPPGLDVVPLSSTLTWTPTETQGPGSYPVTVKVADPTGLVATTSFTIAVTEVNRGPAIGPISNRNVRAGELITLTASASDPDLPANTLTFSLVQGPAGATIDPAGGAFAWTASGLGDHAVIIEVSDGQGATARASFVIHVTRDVTALTLGGATTGQYSDRAAITAHLTSGGTNLAGQQLTISLGAASTTVTSDGSGMATATFGIATPAGTLAIATSFAGTPAYDPSSANGTFTVMREDATLQYTGDAIGLTGRALNLSAAFTDSAAAGYTGANPETGAAAFVGDLTKGRVSFQIFNAATCLSGSPLTTLFAQVADTGAVGDGIGTASTTWSTSSEGTYCVVTSLVAVTGTGTNTFYASPFPTVAGLAVFADTSGKVTGGGWVFDGGEHANFGFNATSTGGNARGNLVFIRRTTYGGTKAILIVKSNAIDSLRTSGSLFPVTAMLSGKASYKIVSLADGSTLVESGAATFTATVIDTGKSGGPDSFGLRALDKNGATLVNFPITAIGGGAVVAHLT